jgi:hypothetical protein
LCGLTHGISHGDKSRARIRRDAPSVNLADASGANQSNRDSLVRSHKTSSENSPEK